MTKNVAVAIVGLPRDFQKTLPTLVDRLVDSPKNQNMVFDIFLVCYEKYYDEKIREIISLSKNCDVFNLHLLSDNYLSFDEKNTGNPYLQEYKLFDYLSELKKEDDQRHFAMTSHVIPQFCQMTRAMSQILSTKKTYGLIVKTRYDVLYEEDVDLNLILGQELDSSYFTCGEKFAFRYADAPNNGYTKRTLKRSAYGPINDPFIVGSQDNMISYFKLVESAEVRSLKPAVRTEDFVTFYVDRVLHKNIKQVDYKMGLWRDFSDRFERKGKKL